MNLSFILLQETPQGIGAFFANPIFMFVIIIAIMYFLMIRPQRKRQKEIENFRRGLQPGQNIITSGGIYGKIKEIEDNVLVIEISNNVNIKVDKASVFADPSSLQQDQTGK